LTLSWLLGSYFHFVRLNVSCVLRPLFRSLNVLKTLWTFSFCFPNCFTLRLFWLNCLNYPEWLDSFCFVLFSFDLMTSILCLTTHVYSFVVGELMNYFELLTEVHGLIDTASFDWFDLFCLGLLSSAFIWLVGFVLFTCHIFSLCLT